MIENPCYDKTTKTSCPNRHGGCANTCSKWAEYVSERDKDYARRRRIAQANNALMDTMSNRAANRYRYIIKDRQYKGKRSD